MPIYEPNRNPINIDQKMTPITVILNFFLDSNKNYT